MTAGKIYKEVDAFLERFKEYAKEAPQEDVSTSDTVQSSANFVHDSNFIRDESLVPRNECVKSLYAHIRKYQFINLTGLGGFGKTSLVNLLTFAVDENNNWLFNRVYRAYVKNNIKGDIVSQMSSLFDGFISKNKPEEDYKALMDGLNKLSANDPDKSKNLLVIDINNCDQNQLNTFVSTLYSATQKADLNYPMGWKVLIVTRYACKKIHPEAQFNIDYDSEKDFDYLKELFETTSRNKNFSDDQLRQLFDQLCYCPLLVRLVARKIAANPQKNTEIINQIFAKKLSVSDEFKCDDITALPDPKYKVEKTIGEYLNDFVKYNELSYNCRYLLRFFMLWPTEPIKEDVIYGLLNGSYLLRNNYSMQNGFFAREITIDMERNRKLSEQKLDEILEMLNNQYLLQDCGGAYILHSLIGDVLRSQCFVNSNFKKEHWFQRYVTNCGIHVCDKDYFNCICSGVELGLFDEEFVTELRSNSHYSMYLREKELSKQIASIKQGKLGDTERVKLAELYLNMEDYHENRMKTDASYDYHAAIDCLLEMPDLGEHRFWFASICCRAGYYDVVNRADYFNLALQIYKNETQLPASAECYYTALLCFALFEQDSNYDSPNDTLLSQYLNFKTILETATDDINEHFIMFAKANLYCRIADSYYKEDNGEVTQRTLDMFDKSAKLFFQLDDEDKFPHYAKMNMADACYRFAFLKERSIITDNKEYDFQDIKDETKLYSSTADSIWKNYGILEQDGELKGFVKTSYGLYDPRLDYNFVKVLKGSFKMGISEQELAKLPVHEKLLFVFSNQHYVEVEEDFYMGMYPVTQGQWGNKLSELNNKLADDYEDLYVLSDYLSMKNDGLENVKLDTGATSAKIDGDGDLYPMIYVNANDADYFVKAINGIGKDMGLSLSYCLPTEAQWEYAARGGNKNEPFYFSGSDNANLSAVYGKDSFLFPNTNFIKGDGPDEVGTRLPNTLGIYDMSGNVWEWCLDYFKGLWYKDPKGATGALCTVDDLNLDINHVHPRPYWINGKKQENVPERSPYRVLRGGCWRTNAINCRVSFRCGDYQFYRLEDFGFRLVLSSQKNETK